MTTRTLRNRTLAERSIYRGWEGKNPCEHIRAELQRVARQVRKLDDSNRGKHKQTIHFTCGYYQAIHDVLELLTEAQR